MHLPADELCIFEEGRMVAASAAPRDDAVLPARPGETVARQPLAFYAAVALRLAEEGIGP